MSTLYTTRKQLSNTTHITIQILRLLVLCMHTCICGCLYMVLVYQNMPRTTIFYLFRCQNWLITKILLSSTSRRNKTHLNLESYIIDWTFPITLESYQIYFCCKLVTVWLTSRTLVTSLRFLLDFFFSFSSFSIITFNILQNHSY